jgi:hypothetical protein
MTMIDDLLRQNWSTLHSLSADVTYGIPQKQPDRAKLMKG